MARRKRVKGRTLFSGCGRRGLVRPHREATRCFGSFHHHRNSSGRLSFSRRRRHARSAAFPHRRRNCLDRNYLDRRSVPSPRATHRRHARSAEFLHRRRSCRDRYYLDRRSVPAPPADSGGWIPARPPSRAAARFSRCVRNPDWTVLGPARVELNHRLTGATGAPRARNRFGRRLTIHAARWSASFPSLRTGASRSPCSPGGFLQVRCGLSLSSGDPKASAPLRAPSNSSGTVRRTA